MASLFRFCLPGLPPCSQDTSADGTTFHPEAISGPIQDRSSVYFDGLRNKWVYSIKASNGMAPPIKSQRMRKYVAQIHPDRSLSFDTSRSRSTLRDHEQPGLDWRGTHVAVWVGVPE